MSTHFFLQFQKILESSLSTGCVKCWFYCKLLVVLPLWNSVEADYKVEETQTFK